MKPCFKCKALLPLELFYPVKGKKANKDGHHSYCKPCVRETVSRTRDREKDRHRSRQWAANNRVAATMRNRRGKLKRAGFTEQSYQEAYIAQGGQCGICHVHERQLSKILFADHCHKRKTPRGLLCGKCNSGLGFFGDDSDRLTRAIEYLKKFSMA